MQGREVEQSLVSAIQHTFYNTLANMMFDMPDITLQNFDLKLKAGIIATLRFVLDRSEKIEGIMLDNGTQMTRLNCPPVYLDLFTLLMRHKFYQNAGQFEVMVRDISALKSFQALDPKAYMLRALGLVSAPKEVAPREIAVTPALIRATFYNEMCLEILEALENKILVHETLRDQEAHIYYALPAMTLLRSIESSKDYSGILLQGNVLLTPANCPLTEGFPLLVKAALALKPIFKDVTKEEYIWVKYLFANDNALPEALRPPEKIGMENAQEQKREEARLQMIDKLTKYVTLVHDIASQISQRQVFNETLPEVLKIAGVPPAPRP